MRRRLNPFFGLLLMGTFLLVGSGCSQSDRPKPTKKMSPADVEWQKIETIFKDYYKAIERGNYEKAQAYFLKRFQPGYTRKRFQEIRSSISSRVPHGVDSKTLKITKVILIGDDEVHVDFKSEKNLPRGVIMEKENGEWRFSK